MSDDATGFGFDEEFGAGANELHTFAIDVEEVRGGVDCAEVAVDVKRVKGGWSGETLGRDALNDITAGYVLLQSVDMILIA